MTYPIVREPEVRAALEEFLKQLGWYMLDMQYSISDEEPLSPEDEQEFDARWSELVKVQHICLAFKQILWDGSPIEKVQ
jgi:hypothetical protein